jgi:hypothetical protein
MSVYDSSHEDGGFDSGAMDMASDGGVVQLQYVDPPSLVGDAVEYYLSINVGGDTRLVSYRIHAGSISAA